MKLSIVLPKAYYYKAQSRYDCYLNNLTTSFLNNSPLVDMSCKLPGDLL